VWRQRSRMGALPPPLPAGSRRRGHPRGTPPRGPCDAGVLSGFDTGSRQTHPLRSWVLPPYSPIHRMECLPPSYLLTKLAEGNSPRVGLRENRFPNSTIFVAIIHSLMNQAGS